MSKVPIIENFINDRVSIQELYEWTTEATSHETPKSDPIWDLHYKVSHASNAYMVELHEWTSTLCRLALKEACREYLEALSVNTLVEMSQDLGMYEEGA